MSSLEELLLRVRACTICEAHLPFPQKPVLIAAKNARIAIIGQAPGTKVHSSGIPWDDLSGKELRRWLGVNTKDFYNPDLFAIIPMGFCYPGSGKSGDLPPRKECAPHWHQKIFSELPNVELVILIGKYAQAYYLKDNQHKNLTQTVLHYTHFLPKYFPLVHPSPRNKIWQKKNPWFEIDVIPKLREAVNEILNKPM